MGLSLLMGSLIFCDVANYAAPHIQSPEFIFYTKLVESAANNTSLFGLVMTVGSGAGLLSTGNFTFTRSKWLILKIVFSIALVLNTMFVIMPNIETMMSLAHKIPKELGPQLLHKIENAKDAEQLSMGINIAICAFLSYLGVFKYSSFKMLNFNFKKKAK